VGFCAGDVGGGRGKHRGNSPAPRTAEARCVAAVA
jgi:hypothetical protein